MKAVIYLRTSTEEQEPENQKKECIKIAENRGYEIKEVLLEKLSGFKQIERPKYEQVKEMARKGEIQAVIVWALDRWVRNRDTLIEDTTVLKSYGCKIHSVKESWLEAINIEGALGRTIQEFLLGLMGSIGEMESERKSERVRLAIRKKDGITKSYKGNKWGRKSLSNQCRNKIIELSKQGKTIREIAKLVTYTKGTNTVNVSRSAVHKTLQEYNEKNIY
jgi:DNA invertase Pin-like site-specific DNA recombinase